MSNEERELPVDHFRRQSNGDALLDLSVLWRRKWILFLSVAVTVGLGVAYVRQATPIYEAEARVLLQPSGLFGEQDLSLSDQFFLKTQAEVIWSPVVVRGALDKAPIGLPEGSMVDPVSLLLRRLSVSPLDDTNVMKIAIRGPDAEECNQLVHAVFESYSEHLTHQERDRNSETVALLRDQEDDLRTRLRELQEEHRELRIRSPQIGGGKEAYSIPMAVIGDIRNRLADTNRRRMELENKLRVSTTYSRASSPHREQLDGVDGPSISEGSGNRPPGTQFAALFSLKPDVDAELPLDKPSTDISLAETAVAAPVEPVQIQQKLWDAKMQVMDLRTVYGSKHPEVVALEEKIDWWEQRLNESHVGEAAATSLELESLKTSERELTQRYEQELATTKTLDTYLLEEQHLLNEIGRVEDVYKSTLTALTDTELEGQALENGHSSIVVRMLEPPELTGKQVWPKPIQFLAVCVAIGLVGGCVVVSLAEFRRQSLARGQV